MKFSQQDLQKALQKKIFSWVDAVFQGELPADIYAKAHCGTPSERLSANLWLKERGYRIVTQPEGVVQIFRGTALVRQTKMVLELEKPEELLQIVEAVSQNVNIPPPPWDPKSGS